MFTDGNSSNVKQVNNIIGTPTRKKDQNIKAEEQISCFWE